MNESNYLWITNISSKCKEEDISRILRRHGEIKNTRIIHHNSGFNALVEFIDHSSASRALHSTNVLKGNILKLECCDSLGNPCISRPNLPFRVEFIPKQKSERPESMLVDRPGPPESSAATLGSSHTSRPLPSSMGHLRFNTQNTTSATNTPSSPKPAPLPTSTMTTTTTMSTTTTNSRRQGSVRDGALKMVFTPVAKMDDNQIKQTLSHELHKFGKTLHVNLVPPQLIAGGQQTRVALVVFRRAEDEEKAFMAYRSGSKTLFGARVDAALCSSANPETAGLSLPNPRIRPTLPPFTKSPPSASSAVPLGQQLRPLPPDSSVAAHSGGSFGGGTNSSPVSPIGPPTRTLIVDGLTVGPNGPVSAEQLATAFGRFGKIIHVNMRTSSNSAEIEFVELREASSAMSAHSRDPLRLGGRPLRLSYAPSRPNTCLWLADLPIHLSRLPETDLLAIFSRIAPVEQMSRINRSTGNQHHPSLTSLHTAAFVRLSTPKDATRLLLYLRAPDSPLFVPSAVTSTTSPPTPSPSHRALSCCPVDFANPNLIERFSNAAAAAPRYPELPSSALKPKSPTPGLRHANLVNGKGQNCSPRVRTPNRVKGIETVEAQRHQQQHHHRINSNNVRLHSSGDEFSASVSSASRSSSASASSVSSSISPPKRSNAENGGLEGSRKGDQTCTSSRLSNASCGSSCETPSVMLATFPSQRHSSEIPLFPSQKRTSSVLRMESPNYNCLIHQKEDVSSRLSPACTPYSDATFESMYDKIKRRTVQTESERRKRPSVEVEVDDDENAVVGDDDNDQRLLKKKKRRRHQYNEDGYPLDDVDARRTKQSSASSSFKPTARKYKRKGSDSPLKPSSSCFHQQRSKRSHAADIPPPKQGKTTMSTADYPSQHHHSNTITRLSLGMSVPVTASYHTISKTTAPTTSSSGVQKPPSSRFHVGISSSSSGSDGENALYPHQPVTAARLVASSPRPSAAPRKQYLSGTYDHAAPGINRSFGSKSTTSRSRSSSSSSATFSPAAVAVARKKSRKQHRRRSGKASIATPIKTSRATASTKPRSSLATNKRHKVNSVPSPSSSSFRTGPGGWSSGSSSSSSSSSNISSDEFHGLSSNGGAVNKNYTNRRGTKSQSISNSKPRLAMGPTKTSGSRPTTTTSTKIRSLSSSSSSSSSDDLCGGGVKTDNKSESIASSRSGSMRHRQVKLSSPWSETAQLPLLLFPPLKVMLDNDAVLSAGAGGDDEDVDSLDDFERFSANSHATPSTEAMGSCVGGLGDDDDDEEAERPVSDWLSGVSSSNSILLSEPEDVPSPHRRSKDDQDDKITEDEEEDEVIKEEEDDDERKPSADHLTQNFEDATLLNCSKDESMNLSGVDAIGEIRMESEIPSRTNDSTDKFSTSKSTVVMTDEEDAVTVPKPNGVKPEPNNPEETFVSPKPFLEKAPSITSPSPPTKIDPSSLNQPPPLISPSDPQQQILSPYSSSSPTPSLCSACSQSSPSPVTVCVLTSSRTSTTTQPEFTTSCHKVVPASEATRPAPPLKTEEQKPATLSDNRDLKRYVQSVIERVKAEKVEDVQQPPPTQQQQTTPHSRSGNTSTTTPITSPQLPPNSTSPSGKKNISPAVSVGSAGGFSATIPIKQSPRALPPTVVTPSPVTRSSVGRTLQRPSAVQFDPPASLPSIPGVNACAPVSEAPIAVAASPKTANSLVAKPPAPVVEVDTHQETKQLRSSARRRGKAVSSAVHPRSTATVPAEGGDAAEKPTTASSKQTTDPYEPNFDDDSPLIATVKPGTSPLVVNTNLTENMSASTVTDCGPASSISSITTDEAIPPLPLQASSSATVTDGNEQLQPAVVAVATSKSTNKNRALDTVDEVISEVCSSRFSIQSYMDNLRKLPVSQAAIAPLSSSSSTTTRTMAAPVTTVRASESKSDVAVPTPPPPLPKFKSKSPTPSSASAPNNNIITVILNALSSIPGSRLVIGSGNPTNGTVTAAASPGSTGTGAALAATITPVTSLGNQQKSPSGVAAITVPFNTAFLKNVISAASSGAAVSPASMKIVAETSQPVPTTTTSAAAATQSQANRQLLSYPAAAASVVTTRPQSTTTESAQGSLAGGRVRHGSETASPAQQQAVLQAQAQVAAAAAATAAAAAAAAYITEHGRSRSGSGLRDEPVPPPLPPPSFYASTARGFAPGSLRTPTPPPPSMMRQVQQQHPMAWQHQSTYTAPPPPHQRVSPPITLIEKLSRVIDPELLVSLIQRIPMQENQLSEADIVASIMKMVQQLTIGAAAAGGGVGEAGPAASSTSSTPSPSQSAAAFGTPQQQSHTPVSSLPSLERHSPTGGGLFTSPPPGASGTNSSSRAGAVESYAPTPRIITPSFPSASGQLPQQQQQYPLVWQGRLSLKNNEAAVKLHFVQGNGELLRACMTLLSLGGGGTPQAALVTSGGPLRIVQRMRLERSQLEGVQRRMTQEGASCACIAFAAGTNREDLAAQNAALSEAFIRYMLEKRAAGIINVGHPDTAQGLYVVHIFPPCEFSYDQLLVAAPELHQSLLHTQMPHLLIVITTV